MSTEFKNKELRKLAIDLKKISLQAHEHGFGLVAIIEAEGPNNTGEGVVHCVLKSPPSDMLGTMYAVACSDGDIQRTFEAMNEFCPNDDLTKIMKEAQKVTSLASFDENHVTYAMRLKAMHDICVTPSTEAQALDVQGLLERELDEDIDDVEGTIKDLCRDTMELNALKDGIDYLLQRCDRDEIATILRRLSEGGADVDEWRTRWSIYNS